MRRSLFKNKQTHLKNMYLQEVLTKIKMLCLRDIYAKPRTHPGPCACSRNGLYTASVVSVCHRRLLLSVTFTFSVQTERTIEPSNISAQQGIQWKSQILYRNDPFLRKVYCRLVNGIRSIFCRYHS